MIVNLNVMCKVQLNELGKVIWLSQIDTLPENSKNNPQIVQQIKSAIDKDDCIELELWGIMNVFGQYISPNTSPFASNTIQINKNPNFYKNS